MKHLLKAAPIGKDILGAGIDFKGIWKNELGSTMTILTQSKGGKITGKYKTAVGKPPKYIEFDLAGVTSGDIITFTVDFGNYGSLATWAGQFTLENKKPVIYTLWHLVMNVNDSKGEKDIWRDTNTGADSFKPVRDKN